MSSVSISNQSSFSIGNSITKDWFLLVKWLSLIFPHKTKLSREGFFIFFSNGDLFLIIFTNSVDTFHILAPGSDKSQVLFLILNRNLEKLENPS